MTTTDRSTPATGPSARTSRWRPVDIVVASVLGVAGGVLFIAWNLAYAPISNALAFYPPASAIVGGVWLLPGVLGGLLIRKPGAAVYVSTVAAVLSALAGNEWGGVLTIWYGVMQGLGAEVVFAALRYRRWSASVVLGAGALAGVVGGVLNIVVYYAEYPAAQKIAYLALIVISGVVIAGGGSLVVAKALRRTGVLAPLASGRGGERV